jgi:hypothetical protein
MHAVRVTLRSQDPFLLYNHEQWAVYSYNLSISVDPSQQPAADRSLGRIRMM